MLSAGGIEICFRPIDRYGLNQSSYSFSELKSLVQNTHEIAIGHGTAAHILGAGNAVRVMTLKGGEWAWFPWDCTYDIYEDANGSSTNALEVWVFVRTGTA